MSEIILFEEQNVDGFFYASDFGAYMYNIIPATFSLEKDQTYIVIWDDVPHENTPIEYTSADGCACIGIGNKLIVGEENSGEPFAIVFNVDQNYIHFFSLDTESSHTVAVYKIEEDPIVEDSEETIGVILKDRNGNDVTYEGIKAVQLLGIDGNMHLFSKGEVASLELGLDFSNGNQVVIPDKGKLLNKVTLLKPENLLPENIIKDIDIAGVIGATEKIENTDIEIDLDFTEGNQVVTAPDGTGYKNVTIVKPDTLLAENIAEGIKIAGIIGTLTNAAENAKIAIGTFTGNDTDKVSIEHGLGVAPDFVIAWRENISKVSNLTPFVAIGFKKTAGAKLGLTYNMLEFENSSSSSLSLARYEDGSGLESGSKIRADETQLHFGLKYVDYYYPGKYFWIAGAGL